MIFLALGTLSWVILLGLLAVLVVVFFKLIKSGKKEAPGLPPPLPQDAADLTIKGAGVRDILSISGFIVPLRNIIPIQSYCTRITCIKPKAYV